MTTPTEINKLTDDLPVGLYALPIKREETVDLMSEDRTVLVETQLHARIRDNDRPLPSRHDAYIRPDGKQVIKMFVIKREV